MDSTTHVEEGKKWLAKYVNILARLGVGLMDSNKEVFMLMNGVESSLVFEVKDK